MLEKNMSKPRAKIELIILKDKLLLFIRNTSSKEIYLVY
jgi:hypothetical protein